MTKLAQYFCMLKKLDAVIAKSYVLPLMVTYFLTTFVFVMQFLWKYIDDIVGKGLELNLVFNLVILFAIIILPMALPLAILLASTMVMGNLAETNELTAYKSCGVSLLRVMRSLIVISIIMAIFAFYFSNRISPYVNLKFFTLLYDIRKQKPALDIKEDVFYRGISSFAIKIDKKGKDNQTLYGILVYDHSSGSGNDVIVTAKKGEIKLSNTGQYLILTLFEGNQYQFQQRKNKQDNSKKEMTKMYFKKWRKIFDLTEFKMQRTDENLFKSNYVMYNTEQLKYLADSVQKEINVSYNEISNNTKSNFIIFRNSNTTNIDTNTINLKNIYARKLNSNITENALNSANSIIASINSSIDSIKWKDNNKIQYLIEWYRKFSLSFACIVLMLIGAVMGAIVRKGGFGFPVLISVLYFVAFHFFNVIGEKLAKSAVLPTAAGMWLSTIVLLPIAAFLTYKALNDSVIFKTEGYQNLVRKIFKKK